MIDNSIPVSLAYLNGFVCLLIAFFLFSKGEFDADFVMFALLCAAFLGAGVLSGRKVYWPAAIAWALAGGLFFFEVFKSPGDGGFGILEGGPFLLLFVLYFFAGAGISIYLEVEA